MFYCSNYIIKREKKGFLLCSTVQLVLIEINVVNGTRVNLIMVDA